MRGPRLVGIVAALPGEGRCLGTLRLNAGAQVRLPGPMLLSLSGIGPARAAAAASTLLEQEVSALASWGFAGALDAALRPGALMLPGCIYDMQGRCYMADAAWLGRLRNVAAPLSVSTGALLTCPAAVRRAAEKRRLRQTFPVVGVDMESAAVAAVAQDAGLPFVAIRSISDTVSTSLPTAAMDAIEVDGSLRPAHALAGLARRPWEVPALLRLMMGAHNARLALRALARLSGAGLMAPAHAETGPVFETS